MLFSKERWVGSNLTFFGPPRLSTKKVCLTSSEAKRVLLWYVLYFSGLRRLNWMKKDPPGIIFGVFRLSKCENTNCACTSSGSLNPQISDTCYSWFHHSRWITLCMAFPCPDVESLDPMDHLLSFDVSLIISKNIWRMIHMTFKPISAYIRGFNH